MVLDDVGQEATTRNKRALNNREKKKVAHSQHARHMSAALGYALLAAGPGLALYTTLIGGRSFLLLVTLAR